MRVLLVDRSVGSTYTLGLVSGLEEIGVQSILAGPAGFPDVLPVMPRSGHRGNFGRKAADLPIGLGRLVHALRAFRPDIVHVQWSAPFDVLVARIARRLTSAPLVFTAHNPDDAIPRQLRLVRDADAVIVHGPLLRDRLLAHSPDAASKTHVIQHGNYDHVVTRMNRDQARTSLPFPVTAPVYVFAGQVRPRKGLETLFEAFAELGAGTLVVCGSLWDDEYAGRLRAQARALGIDVQWLVDDDRVEQEHLDVAISAADQVVLPFHDASQSGSVILGMTHGRCVVASAVGEVSATLQDRGLLVPPADAGALAGAMRRAIEEPEVCEEFGRRARAFAESELAWPALARQTVAVYEACLLSARPAATRGESGAMS